ncbi:MmcQ/YjbR family DNA-binding protein [Luteipulveratus sp. YIM 133132]|uniref:MmcQ/YjbR family DNA-binding protein n=1 Tax=Luteipulveratus flavus TaxID=3031728 RepID=A0ABT6CAX5_9MICO|nr:MULTISPECIES: MmcQ/YjbR family DNA-binding protein [unclassified Luteipulveratus]MDE9364131.1 MmcQ/YjbR family DNA-binding protein [Luteipulveratus sp. YIM 133132]MDF8266045.1 MmcQ/YjbR family DNA-binding protein [Luteipulveratus sp. YIM 133296]
MAHPRRYRDDDPYLARLRGLALALPGAQEKESHGHPNFFTTKVFAVFGGMLKGDHHSDTYAQSVLVLPDEDERAALLEDERCFLPAYYGPSGWVGLNFRATEPDWDEVADLLDMSYRNTAPKRLVTELDGRSG